MKGILKNRLRLILLFVFLVTILFGASVINIAAQTPKDTIVYGCNQIARSLDPVQSICWEERSLMFNIYDTLIGYNPKQINELRPCLAEKWDVSSDGRTWTFYLRKGVKFSTGNELTSEDVLFSLRRGVEINSMNYPPITRYMDIDTGLKAIDDYTVQINLEVPYSGFGQLLTSAMTGIVDSKTLKANMSKEDETGTLYLNNNSLGSGPLMLKEWVHGQKIVLVTNENYWGKEIDFRVPKFKQLIDLHVPEPSTQNMMLIRGDIDIGFDLTAEMVAAFKKDLNAPVRIERVMMIVGTGIIMNTSRGIFQDPKVRQAIRHALNYDVIIKDILGNDAVRLDRPISRPLIGSNDGKNFLYEYDLEKAKRLMQESNYPEGGSFTLTTGTGAGFGAPWDVIGLAEARDLEEIGIKMNLVQVDWSVHDEKLRNGDYDALQMWFSIPFDEAEGAMMGLGHTTDSTWLRRNPYENKEIDALIGEATTELNLAKRTALYEKICQLFAEDGPYAFIAQRIAPFVFRDNVFGYDGSPSSPQRNYATWYKE